METDKTRPRGSDSALAPRRATFARALTTVTQTRTEQTDTLQTPRVRTSRRHTRALALGLLAFVIAGLSAGLGLTASTTPVPASAAQRILARAAALGAASGGSAHVTYALTMTAGVTTTTTLDEWVQRDASGGIAQELLTYTDGSGVLEGRTLVQGGVATTYNVAANTLISGTLNWGDVPDPLDTAALARLSQGQGAAAGARLSAQPDRTVGGHATHVVEIDRPDQPGSPSTVLAFDAQSFVLRALDRTQTPPQGARATLTLRLVGEPQLSATAAPAGTFALGAPPTAHPVVAPDGSPALGMTPLTVAAAVASPRLPAPLLPGHRDGLFLYVAHVSRLPDEVILSYGYSQRPIDQQAQGLGVNIVTAAHPVQPTDPEMTAPAATPQSLTLTIAGQPVTATYYNPPHTASHVLLYIVNGIGVRIAGGNGGMTTDTFLDLVGALVDGHTQPALVTQLQQDLATTPPGSDTPH